MAHTARGSIVELIQEVARGERHSLRELEARLQMVYQQVSELLETQDAARNKYEVRIRELEDFIKNGPKDGPEHERPEARTQAAEDNGPKDGPTRDRPAAYSKLMDVLNRAHDQAAFGKGLDRHVSKEAQPFDEQPICSLQRIYGNGYAFGQVGKKMEESFRLPKKQAIEELLGGLVYLAAAVIVREEGDGEGTEEA